VAKSVQYKAAKALVSKSARKNNRTLDKALGIKRIRPATTRKRTKLDKALTTAATLPTGAAAASGAYTGGGS
jgi:hypothetical protein